MNMVNYDFNSDNYEGNIASGKVVFYIEPLKTGNRKTDVYLIQEKDLTL